MNPNMTDVHQQMPVGCGGRLRAAREAAILRIERGQLDRHLADRVERERQARHRNRRQREEGLGGVAAEFVVTYTYTDETNGYLASLDLFGGQSDTAASDHNPVWAVLELTSPGEENRDNP